MFPSEENFTSVFDSVGWRLNAVYNEAVIPAPQGVTATNCWTDAPLHALILAHRLATAKLALPIQGADGEEILVQ